MPFRPESSDDQCQGSEVTIPGDWQPRLTVSYSVRAVTSLTTDSDLQTLGPATFIPRGCPENQTKQEDTATKPC